MSTALLAAICLAQVGSSSQAPAAKWPLVPDWTFAVNAMDSGSNSPIQHVLVAPQPDAKAGAKPALDKDGSTLFLGLLPSAPAWKTLQIVFLSSGDGTLARFGGISLTVKAGRVAFTKGSTSYDLAPLHADDLNDVQIVRHLDSLSAYVNGKPVSQSILPTSSLLPVQVGLDAWKGQIVGVCGYFRLLTWDEVVANQHAGQALAKPLFGDTKTVTVEAEMGLFTPVPDLDRIVPYRSALVADEYTIKSITSGRMSALKPGMKIRIFRWGLLAGNKMDVAKAKTGDLATMVIQPLSVDPKYEKEFQVDTLDNDISVLYFVDVTPTDKKN